MLKAAQQSGRLPDPDGLRDDRDWRQIAAGLARLPQMGRGPAEKPVPPGRRADGNRGRTRILSGRSVLVAALAFLCGIAVMVAGGNRVFDAPPRTLSVAVLADRAGVAAATVESRSDGSLRVLTTAAPGLPLTLLRLPDASTAEERIGEVPMQGEMVFDGAGIGAAPADYRLARMKDDGSAATTVAAGVARSIVRD